jgi:hypothetical protein
MTIFVRNGDNARFWCPGCDDLHLIDGRWGIAGTDEAPSIIGSVLVSRQYHPEMKAKHGLVDDVCHSFVTDGRIQFLGDCTHAMAGTTVPLPEIPPGFLD